MRWSPAFVVTMIAASTVAASPLDKLTFYTEEFPPFNYRENNRLKGISVEIAETVLDRAGSTLRRNDFKLVPWARGYRHTKRRPNTVLFTTLRTERREDFFVWVGPIASGNVVILGEQGSDPAPRSMAGYNDHKTVVIRSDVGHQLMRTAGVKPSAVIPVANKDKVLKLLRNDRADYWAYDVTVAKYVLRKHNMLSNYKVVHTLKRGDNYFAFNPRTDPEAIQAFRTTFHALKRRGVIARIRASYIGD